MESRPNSDTIADEAVGQKREAAPPQLVTENEKMVPEEAGRRLAPAPGAEADIPEKTAASIGERVGSAYSDPGAIRQDGQGNFDRSAATKAASLASLANCAFSAGKELVEDFSAQISDRPLVSLLAALGVGFIAGTLVGGRR